MGWRFRKSIKILPGVRLNFGKGGLTSATVGGRWLKTNVGSRGVKHTLSAPGTGVSYQTGTRRGGARDRGPLERQADRSPGGGRLLILVAVLLALLLLAVVGVGLLVVLTRQSSERRRPAGISAPHVASKTQAGPAPVARDRS